jgi:hypothetical protein
MGLETEQISCSDPKASSGFIIEGKIHLKNGRRGRMRMREGKGPRPLTVEPGRIPRVSRLMAMAIRFEELVKTGEVQDYADLARLGHVSRARVTQIMNLLNLAPDIQDEILFLPRTLVRRDPITERDLRPILAMVDWTKQRLMWEGVKKRPTEPDSAICPLSCMPSSSV